MKKRILSWLLVLTMVTSLIPSTLVTALAAELPSVQATTARGESLYEMSDGWPSASYWDNYDVIDVAFTKQNGPGVTITVPSGKTLIFHGTGYISQGDLDQTLVVVESGGHLVLDSVTIQNNGVASTGAIYVKSGGLLDLGYNDQKERRAPSITGNEVNGSARNLVIEEGATVRLNASATGHIGLSPAVTLTAPIDAIQGGRYTITNEDAAMITADDSSTLKTIAYQDHVLLRKAKAQIYYSNTRSPRILDGLKIGYLYNRIVERYQNTGKGTILERSKSGGPKPGAIDMSEFSTLKDYDLIIFTEPAGDLTDHMKKLLAEYLQYGGTIYFQGEDTSSTFTDINNTINKWLKKLGVDGFEVMSSPALAYREGRPINAKLNPEDDFAKRLTSGMTEQFHVVNTSPIKASEGVYGILSAKAVNSDVYYNFCSSFLAGERDNGSKWGRIIVNADANMWTKSSEDTWWGYTDSIGGKFLDNLLDVTMENRLSSAMGYNPNETYTPQATTTTTTTTTDKVGDYRTPYAALQKAVQDNTVTLLLDKNQTVESVTDELLFENATLAYETDSKYAGSTIYADTAGVYVDITQTGEVNLRSGTVTVNPANKDYVLTLGGTGLNTAGSAIEGGYKITATGAYTLDADDADTPILTENGGGASIVIPKVGDSVTVTYTGGENGKLNGKTVTYKATEENEKFYLGCYTVSYQTDSSVTWTADDLAWDGHDFNAKMIPATGYEAHGEKLAVVNQDSHTYDNYEMEPGTTEGSGDETWGVFNSKVTVKDGQPKVTIKQQYLHANKVDHNGYATLTVRNVRANIIVRTTGDAVESARPDIYVVGVGVKDGKREQLWAYTTQRTTDDMVTTKDVEGWPWAKWKVVGAKTAEGNQAAYEAGIDDKLWTTQQIKNSTTAGGALCPVELTHGDMVVVFEYEWDMVNVKINAKLGEGDTAIDFPGYTAQYAEVQRDVKSTISAPNLTGYQPSETSVEITPKADQDGNYGPYEVTFYYKLAMGQVIYRAVDAEGHELATWDGPRVLQGDTVSTDYALAPKLAGYQVKQEPGTATAPDNGATDKYDGVNQITVTWVYEPKTRDVEIKMVEYDATKTDHIGTELRTDTTSYAKSPVGFTLNLSAPAIPGYTVVEDANNAEISKSKSVFVEDNDQGKLTVYFYYEVNTQDEAKVTVQLWDKVNNEEIWSYTIPGQNGEKQLVRVPTVKGYISDPSNKDVSIAPDEKTQWGDGVVRFLYSPNTVTVKVKLVDSTKTAGDTDYELNSKLTNYKGSYTVVKGESVDIVAPDIYGYTLKDTTKSVYTVTVDPNESKTEIEEIIEYVPISNQMVNIKVTGTVDGGNDLYTYTVQVAAGSKEYTIDAKQSIPGYKLSGAKVGTSDVFTSVQNDKLTITIPDDARGGTVEVTLTYQSTKTTVTVKAMCGTEELSKYSYTVEKEINAETSVFAPSIPGYTATEQTKTFTPDGTAATSTQTFEYTKNTGNVVLIAKANGVELFRKDGGTKTKGDTINASDFTAPTVNYYERTTADPTITVNGKAFTSGEQYDGIGQIEITYEYQRKTTKITVVKKDADTRKQIETQEVINLPVGETHAFNQTVTTPTGYSAVTNDNPTSVFVEDRTNQKVEFWYRQNENDRYVSITVNLKCGSKVFQSYTVTAIKGQETTIQAPTWTGYELTGNKTSETITPTGSDDTVEFEYTIKNPKTVEVVLKDNANTTNPDAKMTAPTGYTASYTLKEGDSVEIWAPAMDGYSLVGATLNNASQQNMQFVSVRYADLTDSQNTVTFRYLPVAQANFVTHTIKFMLGDEELYSYDKMVAKGTGNVVNYSSTAVADMIPGYTYSHTTYEINGKTAQAGDVKDNVNAVIIYHFKEDTAQITIKFQDEKGQQLTRDNTPVPDQVLTGYRKGQTVEVMAPVLDGFALKTGESLIKTIDLSETEANNDVTFQYVPRGTSYFFLKEKLTDGTEKVIAVVKAEASTTYNPTADGNPLNLSDYGYTFTTDADKVGSDVSTEFTAGGAGSVTTGDPVGNNVYTLYYVKGVRKVVFVPVNKDALDAAGIDLDTALKDTDFDKKYVITSVTPAEPEDARVGETYQAVAQSFNGWALQDSFSKLYKVEKGSEPLKVYFLYAAKSTGDVTVHYHFGDKDNPGKLLNEYTIKAVVGEKVSISAPSYLMDNKYHLRDGQDNPYVLEVTNNTKEVEFYYEANFVVVKTETVVDGGTATAHEPYEVTKDLTTKSGSTTLYPPEKAGYTLVGITATGVNLTNGGADKLPDEYTNNRLNLTGLTQDATVTYYYKTTKASEYQTELTVEYKYNGYDLATAKKINVNTGEANSIEIPAFDGYTAKTYTFKDGNGTESAATDITNASAGITVKPNEKTATLTITYERPDGSVVLPGADNEIAPPQDKDNVTVTPDDANNSLIDNGNGGVKVPDNGTATVTRPDPTNPDDGKEDIIVPGGTTIDKDGTIHLPENGGEIKPGQKIPDVLPDTYVAITYDSNNGSGEVKKEVGKKGQLQVKDSLFTHPTNAKFEGWNDSGLGSGTAYAVGKTVEASVKLYAKWSANYTYRATITYKPNGGTPNKEVFQNVGHDTDPNLKATLQSSPYQVSGWLFGGWCEAANGTDTLYQPNAVLPLKDKDAKVLFAQWYKVNADESITVPGADGNPNTAGDNATAKGNGTDAPKRDEVTGNIEVPKGGSVTLPDGSVIGMPDGGTLKPDGTVIINRPDTDKDGKSDGTITIPGKDNKNPDITDKDGNDVTDAKVITMVYTINNGESNDEVEVKVVKGDTVSILDCPFTWTGHKFVNWMGTDDKEYAPGADYTAGDTDLELHAQWKKEIGADGSAELPGKDGKLEAPDNKDNVIVTPADPDNGGSITPKPDGSVTVDDTNGGTVTRPTDPANPDNKEEIKVPNGTVVEPDGTIQLPDGTEIGPDKRVPDDVTPTDYFVVTYKPGEGSGDVVRQIVAKDTDTTLLGADTFTAPNGKTFDGWLDEDQNSHDAGDQMTVDKSMTFTAKWKDGAPTPPAQNYSADIVFDPNTGDATATQTVTSSDSKTITRNLDSYSKHFTVPTDWTFMGWSSTKAASQSSTFYEDGAEITVMDGDTLNLYAIIYKVDADTDIITLPGKGGQPDDGDDVTVTPGADAGLTVKEGYIEAPAGSEIKQPASNDPIKVIEGSVNVYPDGSVYVPDGSKVQLPDGTTVDGEATIDPDGNPDTDNTKPIQRPDGTIVLPGENGKTGDADDITIAPAGPNQPAGRIDEDGNVTITNPDGADVNLPGNNPEDVKVPNGTVIKPNGDMTLLYTIRYVDGNGTEIKTATVKPVQRGVPETVEAAVISGYTLNDTATKTASGEVSANLADYTITFTYAKENSGGNNGGNTGGGGGGGGSVSSSFVIKASAGNGGIISPSGNVTVVRGKDQSFTINPINGYRISDVIVDGKSKGAVSTYTFETVTANHSIEVKFAKLNSIVADPEVTGVAGWLQTREHIAYLGGYGNGLFGPGDNMTRAQAAQMFYNLLLEKDINVTASFSDVAADAWYAKAVNTLASLGIIKGIGNDQFAPNRTITRAEFTVIAQRFANLSADVTNPFSDVSADDWYYSAVTSAVSYGWIGGYSDGTFRPYATITRAEVATIVNRMLARTADRNFVDGNAVTRFSDVPSTYWAYYNIAEATTAHTHTIDNDGVESWGQMK